MAALGALALVTLAGALPASAKNDNVPPGQAIAQSQRPPAPPGKPVTIDIAAISDFHGQLVSVTDRDGNVTNGGALGVSGVIQQLRMDSDDLIFVSNGDSVGGSAFESAVLGDMPTLDVLNAMGLELSNAGNHEFDKGWADFRDRIMPVSDFPYINSNLTSTPELEELADYTIVESQGISVAFVGTITEEFPTLVMPTGIEGIDVSDAVDAANAVAADLSDGNKLNGEADVVVVLTHAGYQSLATGDFSGDVDAVFTGHTHGSYEGSILNGAGVAIPVLQPQSAGTTVSHLTITYKPATGKAGNSNPRIMKVETETIKTAGYVDMATDEVKDIVEAAVLASEPLGAVVVGLLESDLMRPEGGSSRGGESTIGNFLGGVALWQGDLVTGADFGVINPGGIRANLLAGEVTYREVFNVAPFGNTMATLDLTGEQVDLMLEQQFATYVDGVLTARTGDHPVLRLGISHNVEYVYDPTAPVGEKVSEIFIDNLAVDPEATYTVASNAFLLAGGDGFSVFRSGTNFTGGPVDLDSLIDYFGEFSPVEVDYSQGSTGLHLSAPLVAGETVTASISSLSFTNAEPKPATVDLIVNGEVVGNDLTIDNTVTVKADQTGQATVTFVVPDGVTPENAVVQIVTNDGSTNIEF